MTDFAGWERSKLEKLTELQSRTIEWVGMVLETAAAPEAKVAEAEALVRHYRELKDAMSDSASSSPDASKPRG